MFELEKQNILMFGPCLFEQGGMGAVQKHIVDKMSKELNINHVITWDGKKNTLILFSQALITFFYYLLQNKVDLVHIHVSERGSVLRKSILALISFAFSKPVIMHTHGCEFHTFYDNLPKIAQILLNKIWQNCDRVIVLSKSWKCIYIDKLDLDPNKVIVEYNPIVIPNNIVIGNNNSDKITFLLLGKINQRKGVFDLFQAIALLSDSHREKIELIIAGNGEIKKAIALAKKLKIEDLVRFTGWVNHKQRDLLLQETDIFILPSYNEGLPMALLEAMSFKLPVITTPVGGIPEIVIHGKNGLLVEPGNIPELAKSMQILIDNKSLRLKLGNAAYEEALLLDIKHYSHDFLDIYQSIANDHKKTRLLV